MKDGLLKLIKLSLWTAIILFVVRFLISIGSVIELVNGREWFKLVYTVFGFAGEAVGVTAFLMLLYNRFLWKYLNFYRIPVLKKEYKGFITSSYDNKKRNATLSVKQTFLNISIKMETKESISRSINASIDKYNGFYRLTYTYLNEPELKVYEKSKMHYGTATFDCDDVTCLKGNYYTDRKTIGSIDIKAMAPKEKGA